MNMTQLFFMVSGACLVGALVAITVMVTCDSRLGRQSYKRLDKAIMLLILAHSWMLLFAVVSFFVSENF
jgi:hypothetical protein